MKRRRAAPSYVHAYMLFQFSPPLCFLRSETAAARVYANEIRSVVQDDCGCRRYVAVQTPSLTDMTRRAGANIIIWALTSFSPPLYLGTPGRLPTHSKRLKLDGFLVSGSDTTRRASCLQLTQARDHGEPVVVKASLSQRHLGPWHEV
ncbi:hypothetical protein GY45DRAFT_743903 [Cubamyces sp. BRFM 1775]|nr:hypothetical protein GY45DRAFT_743903 [Cubamyces sp. BRFM 1775]